MQTGAQVTDEAGERDAWQRALQQLPSSSLLWSHYLAFLSSRFSDFTHAAVSTGHVDATLALALAASRAASQRTAARKTAANAANNAANNAASGNAASNAAYGNAANNAAFGNTANNAAFGNAAAGIGAGMGVRVGEEATGVLLSRESDAACMLLQHVAFELACGHGYAAVQLVQAILEWVAFKPTLLGASLLSFLRFLSWCAVGVPGCSVRK